MSSPKKRDALTRRRLSSYRSEEETRGRRCSDSEEEAPFSEETEKPIEKLPPQAPLKPNLSIVYDFIKKNWIVIAFTLLLPFLLAYFYESYLIRRDKRAIQMLIEYLGNLQMKEFPSQSTKLWGHLASVLVTIGKYAEKCPKSVLLLQQDNDLSYRTSSRLISEVANKTASIFGRDPPLTLRSSDLDCDGCIEEARKKVIQHGIVLIYQLEKFSIKAAQQLHFFCDEHDPDFAKAVYLITLTTKNNYTNAPKAAEDTLMSLWTEIKEQNRQALISRLTSLVEFVKPEED